MTTWETFQAPSGISRLRWTFVDGWTIVQRNLTRLRHEPGQIVASLAVPVIFIVLFGYVFGSAIPVPEGGNYREFLLPGLFVMLSVSQVMATASAITRDSGKGVMDRFRSMPMARSAVPFGQTGADNIVGTLELVMMALCGLIAGWRVHNGFWPTAAAFGLLTLLRYAMTWVGAYIGLLIKSEETTDRLFVLIFPVSIISNTFVPTGGMPDWLRVVADWNPISSAVTASRQLFGNPGGDITNGSWPLEHAVLMTLLWSVVLLAIFVPLSIHRHQRAGR